MFRVRNKGFDWLYLKYSVKSIEDLTDDQIINLCLENKEVNCEPVYIRNEENGSK